MAGGGEALFPEVLEYEFLSLHLMNNSKIQEAGEDFASAVQVMGTEQLQDIEEVLSVAYGNADLTEEEVRNMEDPEDDPLYRSRALDLIRSRDRLRREGPEIYRAAEEEFQRKVEEELEIVQATFRDHAIILNGEGQHSVDLREKIRQVDEAMSVVAEKIKEFDQSLSRLQDSAEYMDREMIYDELRSRGAAMDETLKDHGNPYLRPLGLRGSMASSAWMVSSGARSYGTVESIRQYRSQVAMMGPEWITWLSNQYPSEYKKYNSLMAGYHEATWAEFWWTLFDTAVWFVAAEIVSQLAALALAPITAGVSVVAINAARHATRARFLGRIVSGLRDMRAIQAAVRAGGKGIAIAKWLLELPERVMMAIIAKFDDVARAIAKKPPRPRARAGEEGVDIEGRTAGQTAANCRVYACG